MNELFICYPCRKQSETLKKLDQSLKDTEYYHHEAETLRSRYNNVIVDKQRLEKELNSMRLFVEEERKEMAELRRQQQVGTKNMKREKNAFLSKLLLHITSCAFSFFLLRAGHSERRGWPRGIPEHYVRDSPPKLRGCEGRFHHDQIQI